MDARAIEGQAGKLRAFVVPERSTRAERVYDIKPLWPARAPRAWQGDRPMNRSARLRARDDAHHWVGECLGDAEQTLTGRDEVLYDFEHALLELRFG